MATRVTMAIVANGVRIVAVAGLILGWAPSVMARDASPPVFIAQRNVEAEVSKIDRAAGTLFIKTDAGRLKLDIDVAAGVTPVLKEGDPVGLDVTVIRHPDPGALPRGTGSRSSSVVQRIPAEVAAIQHGLGVVSLNSRAGRLNIDLPETAIAGLRTGDELDLELRLGSSTRGGAPTSPDQRKSRAGLAAFLFAIFGRR